MFGKLSNWILFNIYKCYKYYFKIEHKANN